MQWQTVSEAKAKDRIEFGRRRVELMGRATPACDRSAPAAAVQAVACEGRAEIDFRLPPVAAPARSDVSLQWCRPLHEAAHRSGFGARRVLPMFPAASEENRDGEDGVKAHHDNNGAHTDLGASRPARLWRGIILPIPT